MVWLRLHTADLNAPVEKPEHTTSVEKSSLIGMHMYNADRREREIAARVEIATSRSSRRKSAAGSDALILMADWA